MRLRVLYLRRYMQTGEAFVRSLVDYLLYGMLATLQKTVTFVFFFSYLPIFSTCDNMSLAALKWQQRIDSCNAVSPDFSFCERQKKNKLTIFAGNCRIGTILK